MHATINHTHEESRLCFLCLHSIPAPQIKRLSGMISHVPTSGDVINHGKHEFWGRPGVHYHQGMKAGENTLNAICARLVMRDIAQRGG